MHKIPTYFFSLFALCVFIYSSPAIAEANTIDQQRVIVSFHNEVDRQLLNNYADKVVHVFDELPSAVVEVTDVQKKMLQVHPAVESVEVDKPIEKSAQATPWGYKAIKADQRVPSTLSGKGVKIGVLDSGVDIDHPDLRIAGGACMLTIAWSDGCVDSYEDTNGHGTHVTGIVAAQNNSIGTVGVAPNAEIYAIKVLNEYGDGTTATMMAGVEWAIKQDLDIINISVTTEYRDSNLERMIKRAYENGILIVAAAGNWGMNRTTGTSTVDYPAKFDEVIAVGSINEHRMRANLSSVGPEVELAAPGEEIYSTILSGKYGYLSGTSMAAPYVTGMAALYKERYPEMTNQQLRELLQKNALDLGEIGRDKYYGFGLVQSDRNPLSHNVTIPYETNGEGEVKLNMEQAASAFQTYNVYRFDSLIAKEKTASEVIDYASSGTLYYYVYPVVNGKESSDFVSVKVENSDGPLLKDVPLKKWYNRFITFLHHKNVMNGYTDGTIKPERSISRAEAAILIGKSLGMDEPARSTRFKDVSSNINASGYIELLAERGVIGGFPDGSFRPYNNVTRAQMAIMIAKAYEIAGQEGTNFTDITSNVKGYQYVNGLAAESIALGFPDGSFRPQQIITRAEFSSFLAKAINEDMRLIN